MARLSNPTTYVSPTKFQQLAARHPTAVRGIALKKQFIHEKHESLSEADRTIRFVITTGNVDRERDIVNPAGLKTDHYLKNPIVLFGHDYRSLPVAKTVALMAEENRWVSTAQFAAADLYPFADTVYRMIKGGFLNASSIGFRPLEWAFNEDRKGVDFHKIELLEWSIVPVPAHPEALVEARAQGIDLAPLKEWAEKVLDCWGEEDDLYVPREQAEAVYRFAGNGTSTFMHSGIATPANAATTTAGTSTIREPGVEEIEAKPMMMEHACRLQDPDNYDRFRRGTRDHEGKEYSIIFGRPKGGGGWEEQAYRYHKEMWSAGDAGSHCRSHEGTFEAAREEESARPKSEDYDALIWRIETLGERLLKLEDLIENRIAPPAEGAVLEIAEEAGEEVALELVDMEIPEQPTEPTYDVDRDAVVRAIAETVRHELVTTIGGQVQAAINRARGRVD